MNARLLPWTGEGGKECYLIPEEGGSSFVSRLADGIEVVQIGMAEELLDNVDVMVKAGVKSEAGLCHLVTCLRASLRDVIRIAESRGERLTRPDYEGDHREDEEVSLAVRAIIEREIAGSWTTSAEPKAEFGGRQPKESAQ